MRLALLLLSVARLAIADVCSDHRCPPSGVEGACLHGNVNCQTVNWTPETCTPAFGTWCTADASSPEEAEPDAPSPAEPDAPSPPEGSDSNSNDGGIHRKLNVGYFANWAQYRATPYTFTPQSVDFSLFSHICYAFAFVDGGPEWRLRPYEYNDQAQLYPQMVARRDAESPSTKLLLSLGGWGFNSELTWDGKNCAESGGRACPKIFTTMVSTQSNRAAFIRNAMLYAREHGFDGIDIDWEYPGVADRGGEPSDKANYVRLLREFRAAIEAESVPAGKSKFLLSAAVGIGPSTVAAGYDIASMHQYFDWIGLMTYDIHGSWEATVGHHTSMHNPAFDPTNSESWALEGLMEPWLANAPKEKLVFGLASYGRSYTLASPAQNAIGAPASGGGTPQPWTGEAGMWAKFEVDKFLEQGATEVYDEVGQVPYAFLNNQWVGYDNVRSINYKLDYVENLDLAGVMWWEIGLDDFVNGSPLISIASERFRGGDHSTDPEEDEDSTPDIGNDDDDDETGDVIDVPASRTPPPTLMDDNDDGNNVDGAACEHQVSYSVSSSWSNGYNVALVVTAGPSGLPNGWTAKWQLPSNHGFSSGWSGTYDFDRSTGTVTVTPANWLSELKAGQQAEFGFMVSGAVSTDADPPRVEVTGCAAPPPSPISPSDDLIRQIIALLEQLRDGGGAETAELAQRLIDRLLALGAAEEPLTSAMLLEVQTALLQARPSEEIDAERAAAWQDASTGLSDILAEQEHGGSVAGAQDGNSDDGKDIVPVLIGAGVAVAAVAIVVGALVLERVRGSEEKKGTGLGESTCAGDDDADATTVAVSVFSQQPIEVTKAPSPDIDGSSIV